MRHHHNMPRNLFGGLIAAAMLLGGANAMAAFNIGARAGFSATPDQFVIGGQAVVGSVVPMIHLVPSLDLGFGNNVSTTALNIDLQFNLPSLPKVSPNIYVGAGPTLVMADFDKGNSDTDVGISLVAGLRIPMAGISYYNLETRFGLNNVPDLKVLLGIMFGL
jgi:hypothetical protein